MPGATTMISKPMLAATVHSHEFDKIQWPVLASPKLDGIRCLIHPELGPVSRSFKPIANMHIRIGLQERLETGVALDGELMAVDAMGKICTFNETQSAVMSHSGTPLFTYVVFDNFNVPSAPYYQRLNVAQVFTTNIPDVQWLDHVYITNETEFMALASKHIEQGYEGTMLRDPYGPYKSGRSTLNQGWLVKYKEWADAEGTVVGFEERMHNSNEDVRDNLGHAKRSSAKAGMVRMGTLGALILDTEWGELRVGSGLDDFTRETIWNMQAGTLGKKVTFKYQKFGMQDKPRFPIFLHFREDE